MSSRLIAVFTPFENLTDPRLARTRQHALFELVVVALCGTIAGADTWADIERFGKDRLSWLRSFLRLENGIPSHDTFGRVFALLDPAASVACIRQWLDDVGREIGEVAYYFLASLPAKVKTLGKMIRQHWSIESQLHWVLDITFSEDASRIRKQHARRPRPVAASGSVHLVVGHFAQR